MPPESALLVILMEVRSCRFAVDVGQVETVRRKETVLPAAGGPRGLLGFLLLGGTAVPIVDLCDWLGFHGNGESRGGILLVPPWEVSPLAFRVDRIEGPLQLSWQEAAPLPGLLQELQRRRIVWGLIRRGEAVVPLIDLAQVVSSEDTAALLELASALPVARQRIERQTVDRSKGGGNGSAGVG